MMRRRKRTRMKDSTRNLNPQPGGWRNICVNGSSKVMAAMPLRISAMLLRVLAAMPLQFGHISISKNIAAMSLHSGGDAAAKLEIMLQKFIF